jgi:hypothetical protein
VENHKNRLKIISLIMSTVLKVWPRIVFTKNRYIKIRADIILTIFPHQTQELHHKYSRELPKIVSILVLCFSMI